MDPPPPRSVRPRSSSPLEPAAEALLSAREVVLGVEDVEGAGGVDAAAQHRACLLRGEEEGKKEIKNHESAPAQHQPLGSQAPRQSQGAPLPLTLSARL